MIDRYERIREALVMRPTPGPWEVVNKTDVFTPLGARNASGVEAAADDGWHIADCDTGPSYTEEGKEELRAREKEANAALIAACDPDTIRALLNERDALAAEVEWLRRGPHPAITHCDKCGCDWLDNGLNPVGCPYCKQSETVDEAIVERIAALLYEEATDDPWIVAGIEHPGPDRDYYRGLASKVAALVGPTRFMQRPRRTEEGEQQ